MTEEIIRLREELRPKDLHFRHDCNGGYTCGAHKSWNEGFDAAVALCERESVSFEADIDEGIDNGGFLIVWKKELAPFIGKRVKVTVELIDGQL